MIIGILFTVITMSLLGFAAYKSSRNKQNELDNLLNNIQEKQCPWTNEKA